MQKRRLWDGAKFVLLAAVITLSGTNPAFAVVSSSTNYQVTETQFNSGSQLNTCSSGYCAQVSLGESSVGDSASANNTATFGAVTPDRPSLDVIVESGPSSLGELTTETTGSKVMTVKVRSYLSDGYVLQINGEPPHNSGYALQTPSTPTNSTAGTEQFGINVVQNTTPAIGADPVQVPDAETSFGEVKPNYNQPNKFMYQNGDVVGFSTKASGQTDYTISIIVNISNRTPAGSYNGDFSAVVVPLY